MADHIQREEAKVEVDINRYQHIQAILNRLLQFKHSSLESYFGHGSSEVAVNFIDWNAAPGNDGNAFPNRT